MAIGKVEICGIDTSSLPLVRGEESRALLEQVRFQGRGESVDDLFQVGCIGLIKAIDHFDLSQNVRFSTYAVPMKF